MGATADEGGRIPVRSAASALIVSGIVVDLGFAESLWVRVRTDSSLIWLPDWYRGGNRDYSPNCMAWQWAGLAGNGVVAIRLGSGIIQSGPTFAC